MYSAVFFGCPTTSISPSRCTSTPTCSIEVASTTSNGSVFGRVELLAGVLRLDPVPHRGGGGVVRVELQRQIVQGAADVDRGDPGGQLAGDEPAEASRFGAGNPTPGAGCRTRFCTSSAM